MILDLRWNVIDYSVAMRAFRDLCWRCGGLRHGIRSNRFSMLLVRVRADYRIYWRWIKRRPRHARTSAAPRFVVSNDRRARVACVL